ncbi:caspase-8 [Lampris incognitus]|uniref:caspase-8 n=1 Tax=Lampris incognitus TaxID=2546036 RepID=UPI0024B51137|nr:caspase-8 [Lampris incognitus]
MDLLTLSGIDEELGASDVAALCFLCRDVVNEKRLEKVKDGKALFLRLEEKGLLENHHFLSQLLRTIGRFDLDSQLKQDCSQLGNISDPQTDSCPILSNYRVMLYRIHDDLTQENLNKMKFLLNDKLGRRKIESCTTTLDVFAEMERACILSDKKLEELQEIIEQCDAQLALEIKNYRAGAFLPSHQESTQPICNQDSQLPVNSFQRHSLSLSGTLSSSEPRPGRQSLFSDAERNTESSSPQDQTDFYELTKIPRGICLIINNEQFLGIELKDRPGTQEDERALRGIFIRLGFEIRVYNDLTANGIRQVLEDLRRQSFDNADALVVCVLSHGEMGCVFGTDEQKVTLRELTQPFTSGRAKTLAKKPKLFFIQACQGRQYQMGAMPCLPRLKEGVGDRQSTFEEDAGPIHMESVPWDADFLVGMATVEDCKSFRNTTSGSIYIQELCRQLERSAERHEDILTVLTRVNREVSKGVFLSYKQMPEPKYTLTKKLVLSFV